MSKASAVATWRWPTASINWPRPTISNGGSERRRRRISPPPARPFGERSCRNSLFSPAGREPAPPDLEESVAEPPAEIPTESAGEPALSLADVAALNPDSDYRPFMAAAVPEAVHRAALRKLWLSDPIITTHDGLTDYAEDYTFHAQATENVRTIWNAGRDVADAAADAVETGKSPHNPDDGREDRYAQESITNDDAANIGGESRSNA
ncbi:DUF3306 domain-containing protein [bacterium]|nr:DUF3306 domain-containing protein [bacterium]